MTLIDRKCISSFPVRDWRGIMGLSDASDCVFDSPCPEQGMGDEFNLMDHSDLYILDFSEFTLFIFHFKVIYYLT